MHYQKPENYDPLPYAKIAEVANRFFIYSALSSLVWIRRDIGPRVLAPGIGIICVCLLVVGYNVSNPDDSLVCLFFAFASLILGTQQRFKRWREFRKGVRGYSFYLGTSIFRRRLPNFLCRDRIPERFIDPFVIMFFGIFTMQKVPVFGMWGLFSGFCIAAIEQNVRVREVHEQRDLVDGMARSEVQLETVERFSDPPTGRHQPRSPGVIATGLGPDLAPKIRSRPRTDK